MTKPAPTDFFTKELAQAYDDRNSKLLPIAENMHFLIRLILQNLPTKSRVLCVGVGTGAEIFYLAKTFPDWTFVGVDPSAHMLEVCRERLKNIGILERCQLVHGYTQDLPAEASFDATLSILVGHFVKPEERLEFYKNMASRLKKNGILINTEISYDLNSDEFPIMLKNWEWVQTLMGATPESLASLPKQIREIVTVLPNNQVEDLIRKSGVHNPLRFFQSFMISGWQAQKV